MNKMKEYIWIINEFSMVELIARILVTVYIIYGYSQTINLSEQSPTLMIAIAIFMIYWVLEPVMNLFRRKRVIKMSEEEKYE